MSYDDGYRDALKWLRAVLAEDPVRARWWVNEAISSVEATGTPKGKASAAHLAALEKVADAARLLCAELTTDRLPGGGAQWREALALREALAELDKAGGGS